MASYRRLWLLIPAAGESQRFKDNGHIVRKPFLEVRSAPGRVRSMLAHVLESAPWTRTIVALPYGHALPRDVRGCDVLQIVRTASQIDTVRQMLQHVPMNDSVLVMDCDTVMVPEDLAAMMAYDADVVIAVAESSDPEMSRVDAVPFPSRFEEKPSGLRYGVISARMFKEAGALDNAISQNDGSFSNILRYYRETGGTTRAHLVTAWQDWGTPDKLRATGAEII